MIIFKLSIYIQIPMDAKLIMVLYLILLIHNYNFSRIIFDKLLEAMRVIKPHTHATVLIHDKGDIYLSIL